MELERSILRCLFHVAFEPSSLDIQLQELVRSEAWIKCEDVALSSEAARFFIRKHKI